MQPGSAPADQSPAGAQPGYTSDMRRGIAAGLVVGWLLGVATSVGVWLVSGYEYRMLTSTECTRFEAGRLDAGDWTIAPNQPNGCYLRRSRLRLP